MSKLSNSKKTVLFLCTGNSARSQIAEVLLRYKASNQFEVFSAGTHPEEVDPRTLSVLEQFGLSSSFLKSKNVSDFEGKFFDFVITLCDSASLECRDYENAKQQMAWDFPDPKTMALRNPFTKTLHELDKRLSLFIEFEGSEESTQVATNSNTPQEVIEINPISFYKCLTDEVRLKSLMLANYHGELCVCELMRALDEDSQPKVSRNLAVLKKAGIITDRKHGQWVFYRLNPVLPQWMKDVISQTTENNVALIEKDNERLSSMRNRPDKASFCN